MPFGRLSSSPPPINEGRYRRLSSSSDDSSSKASGPGTFQGPTVKNQGKNNKAGGVTGAKPLANGANANSKPKGPFDKFLSLFHCKRGRSPKSSPLQERQVGIQNTKVLISLQSGDTSSLPKDFIDAHKAAVDDFHRDVRVLGFTGSDSASIEKTIEKAFGNMKWTPKTDRPYTSETLYEGISHAFKKEFIFNAAGLDVMTNMKQSGVKCEPGDINTILLAVLGKHGEGTLGLTNLHEADTDKMVKIHAAMVKILSQEAISATSCKDARVEILAAAADHLRNNGIEPNSDEGKTALSELRKDLLNAADDLDARLSKKNDGYMPAVHKGQYITVMQGPFNSFTKKHEGQLSASLL